jgi:hypothetical protein
MHLAQVLHAEVSVGANVREVGEEGIDEPGAPAEEAVVLDQSLAIDQQLGGADFALSKIADLMLTVKERILHFDLNCVQDHCAFSGTLQGLLRDGGAAGLLQQSFLDPLVDLTDRQGQITSRGLNTLALRRQPVVGLGSGIVGGF